jgi:hypothetical protein
MEFSGPVRLRRGYVVVRRDDQRLQLGVDPPHRAIVPDSPPARRLLEALRAGIPGPPIGAEARQLLQQLDDAGLLEPVEAGTTPIAVDAPPALLRRLAPLLAEVRLTVADPLDPSTAETPVLVADDGEIGRDRLDRLLQAGRMHLVVSGGPAAWTVGPFVVPGTTACQRCIDAERLDHDPRRMVVVEQLARLREARGTDTVLRAVALGHAVRDLRAWADGLRPGTWSATYTIGSGPPEVREWLRHPHCGCAWDLLTASS